MHDKLPQLWWFKTTNFLLQFIILGQEFGQSSVELFFYSIWHNLGWPPGILLVTGPVCRVQGCFTHMSGAWWEWLEAWAQVDLSSCARGLSSRIVTLIQLSQASRVSISRNRKLTFLAILLRSGFPSWHHVAFARFCWSKQSQNLPRFKEWGHRFYFWMGHGLHLSKGEVPKHLRVAQFLVIIWGVPSQHSEPKSEPREVFLHYFLNSIGVYIQFMYVCVGGDVASLNSNNLTLKIIAY